MRIAVVDVAAESGGALSVLQDFENFVLSNEAAGKHEWFFFVSTADLKEAENVHVIKIESIKRTRLNRLIWDNKCFQELTRKSNFDIVFSLQNAAVRCGRIPQVVYFHNVLLLEPKNKYSLLKSEERLYAIYTKFIGGYTLNSLKRANTIITQTQTVKNKLSKRNPSLNIEVILPDVNYDQELIKPQKGIIKGFIYPANPVIFKRHEIIVEAVRRVNKVINDFEVIFTFNGNENEYAEKIYERSRKISQIKFSGYLPREEVFRAYRDHALIFASDLESYPIPYVEAIYSNAKIVTCNTDYALEILQKYHRVLYFKHLDIDSLSEVMMMALSEKNEYKSEEYMTINRKSSWELVLDCLLRNYAASK